MAPPKVALEVLQRTRDFYEEGVKLGLAQIGQQTCFGRRSAVQYAASKIGLSVSATRQRLVGADPSLVMAAQLTAAVPADREHLPQSNMVDSIRIKDGVALAFSDAHWTHIGQARSIAHEALLRVARHIQPTHLLALGDLLDLARISKHPRRRRFAPPGNVGVEVACAQTHLGDLRHAAPNAECWWIKGNHDDRLETYLAGQAEGLEGFAGTTLEDNFPAWHFTHKLMINDDCEAIHVWHRGMHAARNNARESGKHFITGDTHALTAVPFTIGDRTHWGIETGMLASPEWPAFHYLNGLPVRWASGFHVLTWRDGELLQPETVRVRGNDAFFRNQLVLSKVRVPAVKVAA